MNVHKRTQGSRLGGRVAAALPAATGIGALTSPVCRRSLQIKHQPGPRCHRRARQKASAAAWQRSRDAAQRRARRKRQHGRLARLDLPFVHFRRCSGCPEVFLVSPNCQAHHRALFASQQLAHTVG